jgi:hypothetical protein
VLGEMRVRSGGRILYLGFALAGSQQQEQR